MPIQKIGVVGAGFMGTGIAQTSAMAGMPVIIADQDIETVTRGLEKTRWSLEKLHRKGDITEQPEVIMQRITPTTDMEGFAGCDLIIEAVYEDPGIKEAIFAKLDEWASPHALLASNTSTIPITRIAAATKRPERVIGLHFFGPVPMMKLLEIVRGEKTSDETLHASLEYARAIGKNPVVVNKDVPGFLMNRVFGAMVLEAMRLVDEGIGTAADIDQGMCDGFNMRRGPIAIADSAGLDITFFAFSLIHQLEPNRFPECPPVLARLVSEGKLGRKTGEGFYKWDDEGRIIGPAF